MSGASPLYCLSLLRTHLPSEDLTCTLVIPALICLNTCTCMFTHAVHTHVVFHRHHLTSSSCHICILHLSVPRLLIHLYTFPVFFFSSPSITPICAISYLSLRHKSLILQFAPCLHIPPACAKVPFSCSCFSVIASLRFMAGLWHHNLPSYIILPHSFSPVYHHPLPWHHPLHATPTSHLSAPRCCLSLEDLYRSLAN